MLSKDSGEQHHPWGISVFSCPFLSFQVPQHLSQGAEISPAVASSLLGHNTFNFFYFFHLLFPIKILLKISAVFFFPLKFLQSSKRFFLTRETPFLRWNPSLMQHCTKYYNAFVYLCFLPWQRFSAMPLTQSAIDVTCQNSHSQAGVSLSWITAGVVHWQVTWQYRLDRVRHQHRTALV